MPLDIYIPAGSLMVLEIHSVKGDFEAAVGGSVWGRWQDEVPDTPQEYALEVLPQVLDLTARDNGSTKFDTSFSLRAKLPSGEIRELAPKRRLKNDGSGGSGGMSFGFRESGN